ncbi:MAG: DUF2079 domain-containing protein [Chloroflexota bacterium]|nr:DUF2079 domain-containing protein [Chloroflexota bacterium]
MLFVAVMLGLLSVARYRGYNVGMKDLGRMSQAIWSVTRGQPLVMTSRYGAQSRLALHVELFYFLLVPLYALFSSPITLLLFQTGLFVSGAIPLYVLARRRLGDALLAGVVALIYLFYPVAQTAVLFDFHGDTLAMPLLLFAIESLDRQAWKNYALWIALALSCKLYVAAPVAVLGGMLWLQGRRRVGMVTFLAGVGWGVVAFWGVRALFAPTTGGEVATTASGYLSFYFGTLWQELPTSLLARGLVAGIVFLPVTVVAWHAPLWLLPAAAVGLPALLSTGPGPSYYYGYHHYALAVPFLMAAVVYGSVRVKRQSPAQRTFVLLVGLMLTILLNSFFVDTPLNPNFWKAKGGQGLAATKYGRTSRDALKDLWLCTSVPEGSPLAASVMLAPHLSNRSTLYLTDYLPEHSGDIMVAVPDALFDYVNLFADGSFEGGPCTTCRLSAHC